MLLPIYCSAPVMTDCFKNLQGPEVGMILHLCSLKEFGPYLCMVSRSRFFGRLMIMMASNGHFCRSTMLQLCFAREILRWSLLQNNILLAPAANA